MRGPSSTFHKRPVCSLRSLPPLAFISPALLMTWFCDRPGSTAMICRRRSTSCLRFTKAGLSTASKVPSSKSALMVTANFSPNRFFVHRKVIKPVSFVHLLQVGDVNRAPRMAVEPRPVDPSDLAG